MRRLRILVDMDDTIEHLLDAWIRCLNERHGTTVKYADVTEWDLCKSFPTLTKEQIYFCDTVIVSLATSYDGVKFSTLNEVASPYNFDDIEYLYDWWEGEKFIKLFGIKSIAEIKIEGGIYEEDE